MAATATNKHFLALTNRAFIGVLASFMAFYSNLTRLTYFEDMLDGKFVIPAVVWIFVLSGSMAYIVEGGGHGNVLTVV